MRDIPYWLRTWEEDLKAMRQKTEAIRQETEAIRQETEAIRQETEILRQQNAALKRLTPEKIKQIVEATLINPVNTQIKQKTAYICVDDYTVEQFLEEWDGPLEDQFDEEEDDDDENSQSNPERQPTQEDYDDYLRGQLFSILCSGGTTREGIQVSDRDVKF